MITFFQELWNCMSYSVDMVTPAVYLIAAVCGLFIGVVQIHMSTARRAASAILAIYVVLVFASTVFCRDAYQETGIRLEPLWSYKAWILGEQMSLFYEDMANIVMMVPVGILMPVAVGKGKWYISVAAAFFMEFLIESSQLIFRCGLCELDDVIGGMAGAVIGYLIYRPFAHMLERLGAQGENGRKLLKRKGRLSN